jgi:large subunit ribosomal protein L3
VKVVEQALLGRKLAMTQVFAEDGRLVPVTVIAAGPCVVVQRRKSGKEGREALQLGYEEVTKGKRLTKPYAGHFRRAGEKAKTEMPVCRHLVEVRLQEPEAYQVGDRIAVDVFAAEQRVDITGTSKGKGFAGVQKRYGFHGGPASHGSMSHRRPASGGATAAARVFPGTKKPGHMGNVRVTVKGLRVQEVNAKENLLLVEGAVPGPNGGLLLVSRPRGRGKAGGEGKGG